MSPWARRAVDHLAPRIGRLTATNAVALAAVKIGVPADAIGREHLPEIARNLSTILRVFLGTEAANQLAADIARMREDS